jgi:hypothetical protein
MRRAQVIGDAPASLVRATGLGSARNGLPPQRAYVHPGWVGGVPSAADWPRDGREATRIERIRATMAARKAERALAAEGRCPGCRYPLDSWGHHVACEGGS